MNRYFTTRADKEYKDWQKNNGNWNAWGYWKTRTVASL